MSNSNNREKKNKSSYSGKNLRRELLRKETNLMAKEP